MVTQLAFDNITTDKISAFSTNEIAADVLRLDKISPAIPGNKWFKLRYYLEEARAQQHKTVLTFGGPWSNHIIATAAACNQQGLKSIGIIRGEEPRELSPTLQAAKEWGMELIFTSRKDYQQKEIPSHLQPEDYYIINEGGYGMTGARGAGTILEYCFPGYTHYCCAVGTGTMMAGLINVVSADQCVLGISVMKNNTGLVQMIQDLVTNDTKNWDVNHDYSLGGYAKHQSELLQFMNKFYNQSGIPSDFVYTGKLFYAVADLISKDYFPSGSRLLLVHSGGLQGNSSLKPGTLIF